MLNKDETGAPLIVDEFELYIGDDKWLRLFQSLCKLKNTDIR